MADGSLIVPVLLANGSLHCPTVSSDALAKNLIDTLTVCEEVTSSVLEGLHDTGWALQHVRRHLNGRKWEEAELEVLGDGIIDPLTSIVPLLERSDNAGSPHRHFSAFPLTSHLHSPVLRLVSLNAALSLSLSFARVPEIHDGFNWVVYYARSSTVEDVIHCVIEELGLAKSLPVPGGGRIEYIIENGSEGTQSSRILSSLLMADLVQSSLESSGQKPRFRFCIPEDWYFRPRVKAFSPASIQPSEDTLKRFEDIQTGKDEEEGTAKQRKSDLASLAADHGTPQPSSLDWRSSLTNLFSGMQQHVVPVSSSSSSTKRKSVSEPVLVKHHTGGSIASISENAVSEDEVLSIDQTEFEHYLDQMVLKGEARDKMYQLPTSKKRQLIEQARASRLTLDGKASRSSQSTHTTLGTSSGGTLIPSLVPQLTGDSGILKRFSMVTWGASSAAPPQPIISPDLNWSSGKCDLGSGNSCTQVEKVAEVISPLQYQTTGAMFSRWWTPSGEEKNNETECTMSVKRYVDGLRRMKTDCKLIKYLISLRVHLSTAKLPWIEGFIAEDGMNALGNILTSLVGKRSPPADMESTIIVEIIKCLRVLLNTQAGFDCVLSSPIIVTHIAYSLYGASLKLRMLAAELLAAICVLSPNQGHKTVTAAFSEYRIAYNELYRFESLVAALRIPDRGNDPSTSDTLSAEEDGIWEARTAFMALVNALANCPESLEDRILVREEFGRRGLNEVIVTLLYTKPPDSLVAQLDLYMEEKYEDEEDLRDRVYKSVQGNGNDRKERSELENFLDDLLQNVKDVKFGPVLMSTLHRLFSIVKSDAQLTFKVDQLAVVDAFVNQISAAGDFRLDWISLIKSFLDAVQPITGHDIHADILNDGMSSKTGLELQSLNLRIDDLTRENLALKTKLEQRMGSNPKPVSPSKAVNESKLVQRLVQKEKEATQLQAELDRLNSRISGSIRDTEEHTKKEREKARLHTLHEEVNKLQHQMSEINDTLSTKDKEILYLKRALESVYTRFQTREGERASDMDAQLIANRTIENLSKREDELAMLKTEITDLRRLLAAKPMPMSETEFKSWNAPPPPPTQGSKSKKTSPIVSEDSILSSISNIISIPPSSAVLQRTESNAIQSMDVSQTAFPSSLLPPPPPPPPPPPFPSSSYVPSSHPPPPPPPPLPTLLILSSTLPPGAPPPPPPPPPIGVAMRVINKAKVNGPRLKPFFWTKTNNQNCGTTVWEESPTSLEFRLDDLEATFSIDNTPSTPSQIASPTRKQSVTTLLDITRANNIAIMLSRFKITPLEICQALLSLDDKISIDDLKAISKQLPSPEEVTRIKDFENVSKLAKADQYLSAIMTIPRLPQRLECMIFRLKLELEIEEIRPDLKIVHNACKELRASQRFKSTLRAVLTVGNALNGSSFRGSARGFRLEALVKMKETRTAKGGPECPTLLHYVARVLIRTDPSLTLFMNEMPSLESAARISFPTLRQNVQSLVASLDKVTEEINLLKQIRIPSDNDHFIAVMQPFSIAVAASINTLETMAAVVETDLRALLSYYGEDLDSPEGPKPDDFFGMICSFSSSLQKAALEIHDANKNTPGLTQPKLLSSSHTKSEEILKVQRNPSGNLLASPEDVYERSASIGRGDLDEAIRSLREGRTRRSRAPRSITRASKIFLDGRPDLL